MAANPLKYIRSAKMTQNYLTQQFILEHPQISRERVRFWPGSFRTRAFWAHGSHMRTVYLRTGFEHANDIMGFLYFHEISWCCSLAWLSSKMKDSICLKIRKQWWIFFLSWQADMLWEILLLPNQIWKDCLHDIPKGVRMIACMSLGRV